MSGCVLRVVGEDFDAAEFLKDTHLKAYRVNDKGFRVLVSDIDDVLQEQIAEVLVWLRENEADLRKLAANSVQMKLDFGLSARDFDKFPVQRDFLPPELLLRAGALNIGLILSHYAPDFGSEAERKFREANPL